MFWQEPQSFWTVNFGHVITLAGAALAVYASHVRGEEKQKQLQAWVKNHEKECDERNKLLITMGQDLVRVSTLLDKLEERVDRVEQRTTVRHGRGHDG